MLSLEAKLIRSGAVNAGNIRNPPTVSSLRRALSKQARINRAVTTGLAEPSQAPNSRANLNSDVANAGAPSQALRSMVGLTHDGQNWAMAALDPCGPIQECNGLPDMMTGSTNTPIYRNEYQIGFDATMFPTGVGATGTGGWDLQVWAPPIPEITFCYRLRDITTNTWSSTRVVRNKETPYIPASGAGGASGITMNGVGYSSYRIIAKGLTLELDAPDIANQGRIVAAQIRAQSQVADREVVGVIGGPPGSVNANAQVTGGPATALEVAYVIPDNPGTLVDSCPRAYQALAKEGVYMPLRFGNTLLGYQFHDAEDGGNDNVNTNSPTGSTPRVINYPHSFLTVLYGDIQAAPEDNSTAFTGDSQFGVAGTLTIGSGNLPAANLMHPNVSTPCDMLTGVIFFSGLAGPSSATSASPATVRVKSRQFNECEAYPSSSVAPYSHPPAMWDEKAIKAVCVVAQQQLDAFPACYNDFGSMMGSIFDTLNRWATPFLKPAKYIPVIGQGASVAQDLIEAGDWYFNKANIF